MANSLAPPTIKCVVLDLISPILQKFTAFTTRVPTAKFARSATPTGRALSATPMLVRWPGKIKPGQISNEIVQHHDWLPTFLAMAGDSDGVEKLKSGYQAIGRTYKNHIDGYNLLPYLTAEALDS